MGIFIPKLLFLEFSFTFLTKVPRGTPENNPTQVRTYIQKESPERKAALRDFSLA
jgi:hypothetical protein